MTTPDGRTAITAGSDDGKVAFWDLDDSRRLVRGVPLASRFVADESTPRGVAVSPDDRTLAVTQNDGTVELLDTSTLEPRAVLEAFDDAGARDRLQPGRAPAGGRRRQGRARALGRAHAVTGPAPRRPARLDPGGRVLARRAPRRRRRRQRRQPHGCRSGTSRSGRQTAFESDFPPTQLEFSPDGRLLAGCRRRSRRRGARRRLRTAGRQAAPRRAGPLRRVLARRQAAVRRPVQRHRHVPLDGELEARRPGHPRARPADPQRALHPRRADARDVERGRHGAAVGRGEPPVDRRAAGGAARRVRRRRR